MAGSSITFPDVAAAQSAILASQWAPDSVAPYLASEFVFDGGQTPSLMNRATPTGNASLIGTPIFNTHSMTTAGNTQGVDGGLIATQADQTFCVVLKTPTVAGGVFADARFTGILYGVSAGKFAFYNSQTGVSPSVPEISPISGGNFMFIIGWGSAGGVGNIQAGQAGALNSAVAGSVSGGIRASAANVQIGAAVNGNPSFEIAYAARATTILSAQARLDWYLSLQAKLSVTVA